MPGKKNRVDLKNNKELRLPFFGLEDGVHEFEVEIGKEFFDSFTDSGIFDSCLNTTILIDKTSNVTTVKVNISGTVDIECDRCLDLYPQEIEFSGSVKIKKGSKIDAENDELWVIPETEDFIDMSLYVYESIILSIPIQRMHPDDEEGEITCNAEMLERYNDIVVSSDDEFEFDFDLDFDDEDDDDFDNKEEEESDNELDESDDNNKESDPRWDALKRLR